VNIETIPHGEDHEWVVVDGEILVCLPVGEVADFIDGLLRRIGG
jgi:hypothetical protein